jgi:RNA-binding protein
VPDRAARRELAAQLCTSLGAQMVQEIGKIVLVYRRNPEADPKLSNILRTRA